jgi:hypothetical protein
VDLMTALGQTLPFAFASGLNLYATIAMLGLVQRFHLVALPSQFEPFGHAVVIGIALALYLVEFVADKIPWVDSIWDMAHTIVRPLGGAVVAITAMGPASPGMDALTGALGASVALASHLAKAGTRAAANTSPEPFSNWILSFVEDLVAIGLAWFAAEHPVIALGITADADPRLRDRPRAVRPAAIHPPGGGGVSRRRRLACRVSQGIIPGFGPPPSQVRL